jgi:hypothetical protein
VSDFKGRHFRGEIVLWAVRWYCRYGISYRDLEQMMAERGVSVGVPRRREIKIDRVAQLVDRSVQVRPLAADLHVGLVDPPARERGRRQCQRSRFSISGAYRCTHR